MTASSSPTLSVAQTLEAKLRAAFAPEHLEIIDESHHHAGHREAGANPRETHFRVRITSQTLAGRPRLAQHRAIYQAAGVLIPEPIHALRLEVNRP